MDASRIALTTIELIWIVVGTCYCVALCIWLWKDGTPVKQKSTEMGKTEEPKPKTPASQQAEEHRSTESRPIQDSNQK